MNVAVVWVLTLISCILVLRAFVSEVQLVRKHEKVSSRFPMFAARDALVRVVLDGKVDEDNEFWRASYRATNGFLNLQRRLDLWDFLKDHVRHNMELQAEERRVRFESFCSEMKGLEKEVPEYGKAIEDMGGALFHMVMTRTSKFGLVALLIFVAMVYGAAKIWRVGGRVFSLQMFRKGLEGLRSSVRTATGAEGAHALAGISMFFLAKTAP
jgi:hypothetical protein